MRIKPKLSQSRENYIFNIDRSKNYIYNSIKNYQRIEVFLMRRV